MTEIMNWQDNTWMLTKSGRRVELLDPDPVTIDLDDIAWHLSGIMRYTGAGKRNISVLEHSAYVYALVCMAGGSPIQQIGALLHDAHEAYMGDVTTPMKRSLRTDAVGRMEDVFDRAIQQSLGVVWDTTDHLIKKADRWAMGFERNALLPPHEDWTFDLSDAPCKIDVPLIYLVPRSTMAEHFAAKVRERIAYIKDHEARPLVAAE